MWLNYNVDMMDILGGGRDGLSYNADRTTGQTFRAEGGIGWIIMCTWNQIWAGYSIPGNYNSRILNYNSNLPTLEYNGIH